MIIRPINKNVLIEVSKRDEKTKGGIVIPDNARKKPGEGKVIAITPKHNSEILAGDIVLFDQFAGQELKFNDKDYIMMKEEDILAKKIIGGLTS